MNPETPEPEAQAPSTESVTPERLTEVFKREYPRLVQRAYRGLSRHKKDRKDEAEELVAGALGNVFEKTRGPVGIGNLVGYWGGAVRNALLNLYRRDDILRQTQPALACELDRSAPSPESLCLSQEQGRLLRETVEHLPAKCRAAFCWMIWEDLTPKEVVARFATEEGINVSERQVLRYRDAGREACRRALDAYEERPIVEEPRKEGIE